MHIDTKDIKILSELDNNARQPVSEIARKVRLNKNVVNYRIRNLEKKGILRGYYAVIDMSTLGYRSIRIYLKLQEVTPKTEQRIINYFQKSKLSWWMGRVRGRWDLAVILRFRDVEEFVNLWDDFSKKFGSHVSEKLICIYYQLYHYKLPFTKAYLDHSAGFELVGSGKQVAIDEKDKKILKLLAENARIPLLSIANKVNLTPAAASYRLKNLIKNKVIVGFRPIINMRKLGYLHFKADFNLRNFDRIEEMKEYAKQHENIFYLNKTIGAYAFEVEFYVKSDTEIFEYIDEIRKRFKENIRSYDFFTFADIVKLSYFSKE